MVYCAKCGTKNEEGIAFCESCGTNLNFRRRERSQNYDNMCFGKKDGGSQTGWIIFGLIIVIVGLSQVIQQTYGWNSDQVWPFVVLMVGALIVISGILNQKTINKAN